MAGFLFVCLAWYVFKEKRIEAGWRPAQRVAPTALGIVAQLGPRPWRPGLDSFAPPLLCLQKPQREATQNRVSA